MSIKKKISVLVIVIIVVCFVLSPLSKYALSLGVMSVYSKMEEKESVMAEKNIGIYIPGGCSTPENDWYPFVMTFNSPEDFGKYVGNDNLKLTILYNFPAFDIWKGCSRIFDVNSPYYSSFYGGYLISEKTGINEDTEEKYGFNKDGTVNSKEVGAIPEYDLQRLVLQDFGLDSSDMTFRWEVTDILSQVEAAGLTGWTKLDAKILMNGLFHRKKENVRSYIQYGSPNFTTDEKTDANLEFAPVEMVGRVYCKYLEREEVSIFLYVLAKTEAALEKTDSDILQKTLLQVDP